MALPIYPVIPVYLAILVHLVILVYPALPGKADKKKPQNNHSEALFERRRLPTLPHCIAVPSAQAGLTSLFGMGRGGTLPQ